jgi:hypothetical protein
MASPALLTWEKVFSDNGSDDVDCDINGDDDHPAAMFGQPGPNGNAIGAWRQQKANSL